MNDEELVRNNCGRARRSFSRITRYLAVIAVSDTGDSVAFIGLASKFNPGLRGKVLEPSNERSSFGFLFLFPRARKLCSCALLYSTVLYCALLSSTVLRIRSRPTRQSPIPHFQSLVHDGMERRMACPRPLVSKYYHR